jgi:hypothetical protein
MTAAAIATMATVEAATITAVSCPLACSRKRKRELYELASARAWPRPSQHQESAWSTTLHDLDPEPAEPRSINRPPTSTHPEHSTSSNAHSPPQVSPRFADATQAHRQPACDVSGDPHTARSTPTANVSYRPRC